MTLTPKHSPIPLATAQRREEIWLRTIEAVLAGNLADRLTIQHMVTLADEILCEFELRFLAGANP